MQSASHMGFRICIRRFLLLSSIYSAPGCSCQSRACVYGLTRLHIILSYEALHNALVGLAGLYMASQCKH